MKSADITLADYLANIEAINTAADIAKIFDTKYQKVDLQKNTVDQCNMLNTKEEEKSLPVL
eukprot:3247141-Ditylum_brightwellii.AAC.1